MVHVAKLGWMLIHLSSRFLIKNYKDKLFHYQFFHNFTKFADGHEAMNWSIITLGKYPNHANERTSKVKCVKNAGVLVVHADMWVHIGAYQTRSMHNMLLPASVLLYYI